MNKGTGASRACEDRKRINANSKNRGRSTVEVNIFNEYLINYLITFEKF
jgi:hypothetical protein